MPMTPRSRMLESGIRIFGTSPAYQAGTTSQSFLQQVRHVAQWSEAAGWTGTLIYTDNSLPDPWLVAQAVIESTERLQPLVAVQPVYMHPYSVAKMVASLGYIYGRRVCLNMVAGGFKNDLIALDDQTPHDERYTRLVEYTKIIMGLLAGREPLSVYGRYYRVTNLTMTPPLATELVPEVFVSGSSDAGMEAARALGALAVQYPRPAAAYAAEPPQGFAACGIRIGVIARPAGADAWSAARARFPEDRKGRLTHQLAMKVSDSEWHKQLSALAEGADSEEHPYWMVPFETYKTFCPYLVGSYDRVGDEIARYVDVGYRTFILDIPASAEELTHIGAAFDRALERVAL